jgi:WD40 repeat protein
MVLADHGGRPVRQLTFSHDGELLVAGTGKALYWWHVATGKQVRVTAAPADQEFAAARFAPAGRELAAVRTGYGDTGPRAAEVLLLDAAGGERRLHRINFVHGAGLVFSPDGRLLAVATYPQNGAAIDVLEAAGGGKLYRLAAPLPTDLLDAWRFGAFTADNRTFLWGTAEGLKSCNALTGAAHPNGGAGPPGPLSWLTLSADGRTLATAGSDQTVLFWDAAALLKPGPPSAKLTGQEVLDCWEGLGHQDANFAWKCVDRLSGDPERAVALLKARLRPVPVADEATLKRLVADVDARQFTTRAKALATLEQLGDLAVAEVRRRLKVGVALE